MKLQQAMLMCTEIAAICGSNQFNYLFKIYLINAFICDSFQDEIEIEEYFRKKYSYNSSLEGEYEYDDDQISPAIQQHACLPDIKYEKCFFFEY